jgi:hypothetical protein
VGRRAWLRRGKSLILTNWYFSCSCFLNDTFLFPWNRLKCSLRPQTSWNAQMLYLG